jgi:hypothetical protein
MRNCLMLFSSLMHLIKIICLLLKMTKIFKSSSSGWRKKSIHLYKSTDNKSWSFYRGTWRPMRTLLDICKVFFAILNLTNSFYTTTQFLWSYNDMIMLLSASEDRYFFLYCTLLIQNLMLKFV